MTAVKLLAGFIAGAISSMGMGGGTVLLLYLRLFTDTPQLKAQGMNLLFFIPIGVISVIIYSKSKLIIWRTVLPIAILGSVGALIGCFLTGVLGVKIISKIFALLLIFLGVQKIVNIIRSSRNSCN